MLRGFIYANRYRLLTLSAGFLLLIIMRQMLGTFDISLGYLYVILVSLAGFWFGVGGGIIAATLASIVFIIEVSIFRSWDARNLAMSGTGLRLIVYFLGGITLGYLSTLEKKLKMKLEELTYYDELTGCVNFHWTLKHLDRELARSKRYEKETSIAMLDIDHFKNINDTYGHMVGNEVLKNFSRLLLETVRNTDTVGRYGGEEFLLIFPETSPQQALSSLERFKEGLSDIKIHLPNSGREATIKIHFSAGIASFPYNGKSIDELISFADSALYRAKKAGRARIFIEQRRWARLTPLEGLRIEMVDLMTNEALSAIEVKNISQRGMLLVLPRKVVSEKLLCRLIFPEGDFSPEFTCKIVRSEKTKDETCSVGVYFLDIPEAVEKEIGKHIRLNGSNNDSSGVIPISS
ncbi:MAG: diguanylate cyclase [Candidatus Omnitrophica bacterium]|nr:diguanylate cyclase [Candidatus Omnitrophota bacterium]